MLIDRHPLCTCACLPAGRARRAVGSRRLVSEKSRLGSRGKQQRSLPLPPPAKIDGRENQTQPRPRARMIHEPLVGFSRRVVFNSPGVACAPRLRRAESICFALTRTAQFGTRTSRPAAHADACRRRPATKWAPREREKSSTICSPPESKRLRAATNIGDGPLIAWRRITSHLISSHLVSLPAPPVSHRRGQDRQPASEQTR